jgi:hypothetical protein
MPELERRFARSREPSTERKIRKDIAQLTAMGFRVTLEPAA